MTTTALPATRPMPTDKILVGLAFLLGLATIAGAWSSQLWGGLAPCELCLGERMPYYWGLPILALILIFWNRIPLTVWYIATLVAAGIFVWSIYLGGYHAGVEYTWWPGPTACTGTGGDLNFGDLSNGALKPVIPCDKVQFRFLGITLAGYNFLISVAIVVLLLGAVVAQLRRKTG